MNIKRSKLLTCAVLLIMLISQVSLFAQKGPKDKFDFPPLHKIHIPKIHKAVLANGLELMFVEDHKFPTIDIRAMIKTGSIYDPADKVGLATITGKVIRTGGSKNVSGDKLDQILESLGATVETGVSQNSGYAYISLLKNDIDKGLEILADLLINPAFPEEKINLAKIEAKSSISRRNDNVGMIANREFKKLIYGPEHPYARTPEYATIDAITRDDILDFHKKYFHPNNIIMAAWGDFDWKVLKGKIEKYFGQWKEVPVKLPPKPEVNYSFDYSVNFIEKTDVNQSNILLGHIGGLRNNPDYPALLIMNQILSFQRMFKKIRTDEGLAYSVYGNYGADYDHPGVFQCGCQTKCKTTVKAVKLMLNELKKIQEEFVSDEELKKAKDMYLNGFVFNFDSKAKVVGRLLVYDYYNYPENFITSVKEGVEKVTKDDVQRVAKKYLQPDKVRILVVGNPKDFDEPLSVLGKVNTIDITIPTPKESAPEATKESVEKGKKLFAKVLAATGGSENISKISNMRSSLTLKQVTPMGEMALEGSVLMVYPDKLKAAIQSPMGEVNLLLSGDKGKMVIPGRGEMPMPPAQFKTYKESILRDPIYFLTKVSNISVQYIGTKDVEGKECEDILVTIDSFSMHLLIDPATNLPAAMIYTQTGNQGPEKVEDIFYDYKTIDGVSLPMRTVSITLKDGKKAAESIVKEMKFNVNTDLNVFDF